MWSELQISCVERATRLPEGQTTGPRPLSIATTYFSPDKMSVMTPSLCDTLPSSTSIKQKHTIKPQRPNSNILSQKPTAWLHCVVDFSNIALDIVETQGGKKEGTECACLISKRALDIFVDWLFSLFPALPRTLLQLQIANDRYAKWGSYKVLSHFIKETHILCVCQLARGAV